MTIEFKDLNKRNLIVLLNTINECTLKVTHQRGECDTHNCSSCLNRAACVILCNISNELNKELENFQNAIDK